MIWIIVGVSLLVQVPVASILMRVIEKKRRRTEWGYWKWRTRALAAYGVMESYGIVPGSKYIDGENWPVEAENEDPRKRGRG